MPASVVFELALAFLGLLTVVLSLDDDSPIVPGIGTFMVLLAVVSFVV